MNLQIIQVPYDSGNRGARMGGGPEHFVNRGLAQQLSDLGHDVSLGTVEAAGELTLEVGTTFELNRALAERVREAVNAGRVPLVLAGNCVSCLGTLAGLGAEPIGILWLDAHGDFNTPETSTTGFLDGMALSIAVGHCWTGIARTIPGFVPVPEANVLLVGVRDLDPEERRRVEASNIIWIPARPIIEDGPLAALATPLEALGHRARRVYLHIDLDVLDPQVAHANRLAAPGGLTVEQVSEIIRLASARFVIAALAITAYDPSFDSDGRTYRAGVEIMKTALG